MCSSVLIFFFSFLSFSFVLLGAAAFDDAIAWCLLALAISIAAGQGGGHETGYIFGTMVGFVLFELLVIKPLLEWFVPWAEAGNSPYIVPNLFGLTVCLLFMSAWFTGILFSIVCLFHRSSFFFTSSFPSCFFCLVSFLFISAPLSSLSYPLFLALSELIGLDHIFGAFVFGLTIPRGSRLFHQCNQYIEHFVLTFTLPLYFALSGLKTDVTTISTGKQGGMIILVIVCATVGKFCGCGLISYFSGMDVRESITIGALMNTRGLVELIVLNVGLNAGILNTRTFSVMVIMALFTTFTTSPVVNYFYPESIRMKAASMIQHDKEEEDTENGGIRITNGEKDGMELVSLLKEKDEFSGMLYFFFIIVGLFFYFSVFYLSVVFSITFPFTLVSLVAFFLSFFSLLFALDQSTNTYFHSFVFARFLY
jgi:Kef-type K+ transport system membrane component KefB